MAEKKKTEARGLELHQNMMQTFTERFEDTAFGRGFESSTDPNESQGRRSDSLMSEEGVSAPFADVLKMKTIVVFDAQENKVQIDVEKELAHTRTMHSNRLTPDDRSKQLNSSLRRPSDIGSPSLRPSELGSATLQHSEVSSPLYQPDS